MGLGLGGGEVVHAIVHSLNDAIALDMVLVGARDLFSKSKRFLAVHIVHAIQGKRLVAIPTGGKLMRWRDV
ncbi:hypothetical protein Bca4012_058113 [Brassica carinata]